MIVRLLFVLTGVGLLADWCTCAKTTTPQYHEYREECRVWDNVTRILVQQPGITMNCWKNDICTGIQCNGRYSYNGVYAFGSDVQEDFCYGMYLHPCATPLQLHFFVDMPDRHSSYEHTVHSDDTVQLPGLHYDLGLGSADGFIQVDMEPQTRNGKPYVQLGLLFKVRVSTAWGLETWPDSLKRKLMPDTLVPVPVCDKKVPVPHDLGHTCNNLTTPSPGAETPYPTTTRPLTTLSGKKCQVDAIDECGHNQMCDAGVCQCIPGYQNDSRTGACQAVSTTISIIPYPIEPVDENSGKSTSHSNAIIIGSCVAAAVLIVGGLLVVFLIIYRKHHARYGQHDILLNSTEDDVLLNSTEDDGDDDPLDIST